MQQAMQKTMQEATQQGIELRIKGKVQGVGFRPFVWHIAQQHGLQGDVNNDGQGVLIRLIQPEQQALQGFLQDLQQKLPPLAQINHIQQSNAQWQDLKPAQGFQIRASENSQMDTQIIPDAGTCSACVADIFSPQNRRYQYAFTNCTHCGPRFSIIKAIPYDRKNTAMADFALCPRCQQEYQNPADRRFHAQPNACPECGPQLWLQTSQQILDKKTPIKSTALLLRQGKILAIKGIGGFHLACDATNSHAVASLRQRKQRPTKPLAIMVPNLSFLQNLTHEEQQCLTSTASPILLLAKHKVCALAENIAPNLHEIGVMLPSNPLQHLLLAEINQPLVMTSANPSGQPPVLDNQSALRELANFADAFLCHNRDILQRADDSLVRLAFDGIETLRRARGYVPNALELNQQNAPAILALGSDLKHTFCVLKNQQAIVSQHIGDCANELVQQQLQQNLDLFQQIYQFQPELIAIDAHAGYFSHQLGKQLAQQWAIPHVEILHHHAHIASVLAEHHCQQEVIGLALDGIGMGENHQLWGGECLLVSPQGCKHLGGLPAVALAGGDLASKQPWRNWLAHLQQFVENWQEIMAQTCTDKDWQLLSKAIERHLNAPLISSAGRLFDAVAYGLKIAPAQLSWEGEGACQLEALAYQSQYYSVLEHLEHACPLQMPVKNNQLDLGAFWQSWFADKSCAQDKALFFHYALAQGFAQLASQQAKLHGCNIIVLAGGVMHNQLLRRLLKQQLAEFQVLSAHLYPMGDGGLSLGQAWIGAELINKPRGLTDE